MYYWTCAPSDDSHASREDSDQTARIAQSDQNLPWTHFAIVNDATFHHAVNKDSNQTARMRRRTSVFAGRT